MNIFVPYDDLEKNVEFLDDKRVIVQCKELGQLLATAVRHHCPEIDFDIPQMAHINHPITKWVYYSRQNYTKTFKRFISALDEYKYRAEKEHAYTRIIPYLVEGTKYIPEKEEWPFLNAAENKTLGISFKHVENVHEAYRLYLQKRWQGDKRPPTWTKRTAQYNV